MARAKKKANGKAVVKAPSRPRKRMVCWTTKKKMEFLALVALGWTVVAAAQEVKMSKNAVYELRNRDSAFLEAMEKAYEESTALLEGVAFKKAVGWIQPVIQKDGTVLMMEKHDPILLMFLLKARKPRMYRDQIDVNINEKRHITIDLVMVEKDEATGRLMLVDEMQPPLLTSGEGE
jgi:hypothetical protein